MFKKILIKLADFLKREEPIVQPVKKTRKPRAKKGE